MTKENNFMSNDKTETEGNQPYDYSFLVRAGRSGNSRRNHRTVANGWHFLLIISRAIFLRSSI